jgi:hypothetical protein
MPDQGNRGPQSALPDVGSPDWWAQRVVLAELVVTPPSGGDTLSYLREYLPIEPDAVEPAIAALEGVGLVTRYREIVRATAVAKYVEHLWPIRP